MVDRRDMHLRRRVTADVDISSIAFWSRPFDERERAFAALRRDEPVSWHPQLETPGLPARRREPGFWAVTTAEDIRVVSRDSAGFSSALRQVSVRPTPYRLEPNMLVSDPPDHGLYRLALGAAFAPAALRARTPAIERAVRQVVLRSTFRTSFDVVTGIAAGVPARVLALLLGIPEAEQQRFVPAVDAFASGAVPTELMGDDRALGAWFVEQRAYLTELIDDLLRLRSARPGDDVISLLAAAADQAGLGRDALRSTVLLLVVAGHDTMKQLIGLSVLALVQHETQRRWLLEDLERRFDTAFEELLRWTTPILSFARTATRDLELGGAGIHRGDKVAMFYCSGNRDEREFDEAGALRLDRAPNGNVAFGGGGVHFCLGGALARIQLRAVVVTLFGKAPELALAGEPVFGFDDAIHRLDALPVRRP